MLTNSYFSTHAMMTHRQQLLHTFFIVLQCFTYCRLKTLKDLPIATNTQVQAIAEIVCVGTDVVRPCGTTLVSPNVQHHTECCPINTTWQSGTHGNLARTIPQVDQKTVKRLRYSTHCLHIRLHPKHRAVQRIGCFAPL